MSSELVLTLGTSVMLVLAFSIILFIYLYQRKLIKKSLENQKINDLLQEQEMKTAYALLEGQDKERKRIASELHDNLGSILTSLNMFADAIQKKQSPAQLKKIADKISETSNLANEEVRKISHSLDSGLLKHFGLKAAVSQLMEAITTSKNIKVELELELNRDFSSEKGLEIYRIIQELSNNSLKHSKCTRIRLDITEVNHDLSIIFQDNGIGFNPNQNTEGMGLKNIRKRVEKLNGDLTIESKPEKGATFIIELTDV
ncbi:MAG: hypothetical protein Tsb0034_04580 [Ekhidna sp.]